MPKTTGTSPTGRLTWYGNVWDLCSPAMFLCHLLQGMVNIYITIYVNIEKAMENGDLAR